MNFQMFKERIASLKVVYSVRDRVPYKVCSVQGKSVDDSEGKYRKLRRNQTG